MYFSYNYNIHVRLGNLNFNKSLPGSIMQILVSANAQFDDEVSRTYEPEDGDDSGDHFRILVHQFVSVFAATLSFGPERQ